MLVMDWKIVCIWRQFKYPFIAISDKKFLRFLTCGNFDNLCKQKSTQIVFTVKNAHYVNDGSVVKKVTNHLTVSARRNINNGFYSITNRWLRIFYSSTAILYPEKLQFIEYIIMGVIHYSSLCFFFVIEVLHGIPMISNI